MTLIRDLDQLLQLENRALMAADVAALRFTIVNETHALVPYRQAVLFDASSGRLSLVAASGLVNVAEDAPFTIWLSQMVKRLPQDAQIHYIQHADAPEVDQAGWTEWLPEHLLLIPLTDKSGARLGLALYARDDAWVEEDIALLQRLHLVYSHALLAQQQSSARGWRHRLRQWRWHHTAWLLGVLALLSFVPVRLSVLAPAEVVALHAMAVAAPQEGVIGRFGVRPNSLVKNGDLLFTLDDSALNSRREVAAKALEVVQVDAHVAQQRAFDDLRGRAELASLLGKVREKEAELATIDALAKRVEVRASKDAVAIFSDVNDWIGRPVQTGERVMQLAQPEDAGVLVWLAVADAINLEQGATVQLFLHTDPLRPRSAELVEASYQATLSPEDVASYRLRARFVDNKELPRIGLRGTARISGEWVSLGYYLFRRPIAAAREWLGL